MTQPVPANALGPELNLSAGLAVEEIGDRVFLVTDGDVQATIVDADDGVVVMDAPWDEDYLAAIRRITQAPITHLIYSHSHYDHIGGAHYLDAETVIGQTATAEVLGRHADPRRPVPSVVFQDRMTLDLGEHRIDLRDHGPNHQDGNIFIHLPRQRLLMLVDVIVPGWVPFYALGGATDVAGYLDAHDIALDYDFDTLVAGHLTRVGTPADVRTQREYLANVRRACTHARTTARPAAIAQQMGTLDKWRFVSAYFDELAHTAADNVIPHWTQRLGGVAAFTHSHCMAMTIALAHEWGLEPAS